MKKLMFALCIAIAFSTVSFAQQGIFFEGGGPGVASFNFDSRFTGRSDGIGARVGIGGYSVNDETALFFPIQLNYLLGNDNKNFFEMGGGVTIVNYKNNFSGDDKNGTFQRDFGHLYFGYRRQPAKGGFLFRAGLCPIFNITRHNSFFIPYYAGVSFGYAF